MSIEKYRKALLDIENVLPMLSKISILGGLNDAQLYTVFRLLDVEHYNKGERVFRKGDSPNHIWIIRSGRVRIVEDIDGVSMELIEFVMGDCFGEASMMSIHQHTASALVMEPTELLVIPREKLFALYKEDPKLFGMLMMNIAREACRRLNKTENIMLHYALTGRRIK